MANKYTIPLDIGVLLLYVIMGLAAASSLCLATIDLTKILFDHFSPARVACRQTLHQCWLPELSHSNATDMHYFHHKWTRTPLIESMAGDLHQYDQHVPSFEEAETLIRSLGKSNLNSHTESYISTVGDIIASEQLVNRTKAFIMQRLVPCYLAIQRCHNIDPDTASIRDLAGMTWLLLDRGLLRAKMDSCDSHWLSNSESVATLYASLKDLREGGLDVHRSAIEQPKNDVLKRFVPVAPQKFSKDSSADPSQIHSVNRSLELLDHHKYVMEEYSRCFRDATDTLFYRFVVYKILQSGLNLSISDLERIKSLWLELPAGWAGWETIEEWSEWSEHEEQMDSWYS